ncbi:myb-like protein D isoform X2 [Chironomus tepperi]
MDDEVTQIFKKWKLNNPLPKKDNENINSVNIVNNETFDSRTFTRPAKRRTFNISDSNTPSLQTVNSEMQSMESGIASINLQVGGTYTPLSMQRSWLNDVSPPSSICTSMDFQNNDTMLNSLITSSDFTNVSFLLNGSTHDNLEQTRRLNNANIINNNNNNNNLESPATPVNNPNNISRNLMNFTFDINKTITNSQPNATFVGNTFVATTDSEPIKEIGIENADMQLNVSTEDFGKNLTFNKYDNCNITWENVQDQHLSNENILNSNVVQSTPVHNHPENDHNNKLRKDFDDTISPISSLHAQNLDDDDEDDEVLLRNIKGRRLVDTITMEDYRNSIEDQCEFLLNEETIKLSNRVCGESFECLRELRDALITSTDANEKEFDEMLDTFNVEKSREGEKLLQSVDSIKQRHSLINMEKQKEDKRQKKDCENDNRTQYDVMNKSSERLLNRRSRLFDDVNLQLQKQQNEASMNGNGNGTGSVTSSIHHNSQSIGNDAENEDEVIDKNDRDRFKTIKLNRPRLQTGMVIVNTEEPEESQQPQIPHNEVSPGSNKERRNQINQQKQQEDESEFKKPPAVSKLSKFGFSRPTYKSRNDLNLPLKANSTDSLDNDSDMSTNTKKTVSNLKSPMGIKSKSIHNLMYNGNSGAQNGFRMTSNLKLYPETTRSQSNLKGPRASSLVRPVDNNFKVPQTFQPRAQTNRKAAGLVRPSSGYYGNGTTKRLDSDNESYSLSSSSASSRNSVHISHAAEQQLYQQNSTEELDQPIKKPSGAIPKPSGIARPMSGLPRPQVKSGLPHPKSITRPATTS